MPQRYEIEIFNPGEMARLLAFWDRHQAQNQDSNVTPPIEEALVA
jgi:hypothetical protein